MRVLSLFDGISCGMVAMERAGIPVEEYSAFEIDKFASGISKKNYPGIKRFGDVFDGNFKDFKGYDVLLGGSPCTYWSIAKNNREISPDGKGGELFMQYIRALEDSGCKYFLYENNNSIHQDIKDFISEKIIEIGTSFAIRWNIKKHRLIELCFIHYFSLFKTSIISDGVTTKLFTG
jgi:DNA (cytosine-5)-methyltransferase 3A